MREPHHHTSRTARAARLAALATAAYFMLSLGALQLLALDPPPWLEQTISALAMPAMLLLAIWNPVLAPLGMVSGEWWTMPNFPASLLLIALYAAIAGLAGAGIARIKQRGARGPG